APAAWRLDFAGGTAGSWMSCGIPARSGPFHMSVMQRVRRGVFVTLMFGGVALPAHAAEPLTLFLLKMLRDQIATSVIESAVNSATLPAASAPVVAPALVGVYGV